VRSQWERLTHAVGDSLTKRVPYSWVCIRLSSVRHVRVHYQSPHAHEHSFRFHVRFKMAHVRRIRRRGFFLRRACLQALHHADAALAWHDVHYDVRSSSDSVSDRCSAHIVSACLIVLDRQARFSSGICAARLRPFVGTLPLPGSSFEPATWSAT